MFIQMQAFGRVERDPELQVAENGSSHSNFTLAVDTKRCVQNVTVPLFCYGWGEQAENILNTITKGSLIFVQGHFSYQPYITEEGKPEVRLEVSVERFQLATEDTAAA